MLCTTASRNANNQAAQKAQVVPIVRGRQESACCGNLGPPRAPCFGGGGSSCDWRLSGNADQMALDAVQDFPHEGAHVLAQDFDQPAEQVACSCSYCLHARAQSATLKVTQSVRLLVPQFFDVIQNFSKKNTLVSSKKYVHNLGRCMRSM